MTIFNLPDPPHINMNECLKGKPCQMEGYLAGIYKEIGKLLNFTRIIFMYENQNKLDSCILHFNI